MVRGPDGSALHPDADLPAAAIHRIDLGFESLVASARQPGDGLLELFDWQPDVEPEKMLPLHFIPAKAPEIGRDVVPELHLQVLVEHDYGHRDAAQDTAQENVAPRQVGAALPQ